MAQQTLNNNEAALSFRTKLNENFTELYDGTLVGITDPIVDTLLMYDVSASAWVAATIGSGLSISGTTITATGDGTGDLLASNNLSDLDNAATARTNLGLGSAATTESTAYATAAQGALAASALQSDDVGAAAISNDYVDLDNRPSIPTLPLSFAEFGANSSADLAGVISDETGTGALVFANSPTLVSPALGTPASGDLANCTGLPVSAVTGAVKSDVTGITGADAVTNIVSLTQAEYDAIVTPDSSTFYIITDA